MAEILIVDDNDLMCEMLQEKLATLGHQADYVHTLKGAVDQASKSPYDVILLDVSLPDGNGLDLIPTLRELKSNPEVIIITGKGSPDGAELAVRSGAWTYLTKDNVVKEITLPLERALQFREEKGKDQPALFTLKRRNIIGASKQIKKCLEKLTQAAMSEVNVLVSGSTGTGKELFARAIHENSSRAKQHFVVVDCAALPESLIESTLFGHVKGSFTGADSDRKGLVQQADGGTLFLDEIGELPSAIQKQFLRVLQEKRFRPIGSTKEVKSNFRLVAATHRDLSKMVEEETFREDLFHRIKAFEINLPPLKDRQGDIKELARHFITMLTDRYGHTRKELSHDFLEELIAYPWPGNVRELFQALDHVFTVAFHSSILYPQHLPENIRVANLRSSIRTNEPEKLESIVPEPSGPLPVFQKVKDTMEYNYLVQLLDSTETMKEATRISGFSRSRLYQLLKKHDLLSQE